MTSETGSSPLAISDASSPLGASDVANTPSAIAGERSSPAPFTPQSTGDVDNPMSSPPLSIANTPRGSSRGRPSPNSLGRSDLGSRSNLSDRTGGSRPGSDLGSTGSNTSGTHPRAMIWGTSVDATKTQKHFREFFLHFREEGQEEGRPFYQMYIEQLVELQEQWVNLDCRHVKSYDESLYNQIINYPTEVIAICDIVLSEILNEKFPEADMPEMRLMARMFNLEKENKLRELDPMDIDKLISIKGMVTRTSGVIPDLKVAFFECAVCETSQSVYIDRGQIAEPQICINPACQAKNNMRIVHNRCVFVDKQIIRLQEAPEDMPEGETPQTVSMCTWQKMVDLAKPGDRVEITGVYRALPVRVNPRHRTVRSLYKTYIDIQHVRKIERGMLEGEKDKSETNVQFEETNELNEEVEARKERVLQLSKKEGLYQELSDALAPSVWEMDDVKKGILLQLFGATHKTIDAEAAGGASRKRGDLNVLLVGDPGTSKSQLLQYVKKIMPRCIYTSGKGSSAVGLTAYVTKDPETRQFVLESGALVLADRGVCCIDEFDKMSEAARSILHEAMEQQTVSVAKAGIICSLNARTSVLAAANPIESKYDPNRSVVENINLPPSLLSRFDLIYLVLDKPQEDTDRQLAQHLVALYRLDRPPAPALISQTALMEYITYAKREVHPKLSAEAAGQLVDTYVKMRQVGANRKVVTATPRQLESLIRLAEAHARMRLSATVDPSDVDEANRLMQAAMQTSAMDPKTGCIDMDSITTGRSASARSMMNQLAAELKQALLSRSGQNLGLNDLLKETQENSGLEISMQELKDALGVLARDNLVRVARTLVTVL